MSAIISCYIYILGIGKKMFRNCLDKVAVYEVMLKYIIIYVQVIFIFSLESILYNLGILKVFTFLKQVITL